LDTFSLTSSSVFKPGFQTASPDLQKDIPEASFSYERRQPARTQLFNHEKVRKNTQMWTGSFMTNNTDAADSLLAAATRLEGLVKTETEYWGQLLSLSSNGWPVYKPNGADATMHVRFVASEASPYFRFQGVARLTPDVDGTVKLGRRVGSEPRTLRLRLSRGNEIISSSITASQLSLADLGSSLEDKVRREQNSLFEEELFQEMAMESRILQPLGVKLRNNVLHLPLTSIQGSQDECLIDLVAIDEAADLVTNGVNEVHELLDAQSVLLRLLLCHVYHRRLQRRSRLPSPLSENALKEPPSSIIRSFLTLTQHRNICLPLSKFLSGVNKVLAAAGIPFSCDKPKVPGLHDLLERIGKDSTVVDNSSNLHLLLEQATRPQKTTEKLKLVEKGTDGSTTVHIVTIQAYTDLSPPLYGSGFSVELPQAIARLNYGQNSHDKKVTFSHFADLKTFLCQLLPMQLTRQLLLPSPGWATASADLPIISRQYGDPAKGFKVMIGIQLNDTRIELRRRLLNGVKQQDTKVWTATSTNSTTLSDVFEAWANEARNS
jgi:mediator of RNA polymerase II transcription subunit 17